MNSPNRRTPVQAVLASILILAGAAACSSATDDAIRPIDQSGTPTTAGSAITDPTPTSVQSATTKRAGGTSTTSPSKEPRSTTSTARPPTTRGKVVTTVTVDLSAPGAKKPTNGAPLVSITTTTRPDGKSPTHEVDQIPNAKLVFSNKPMKAASASRAADGTVTSAGGYVARTIQTANGMLLEPKWTKAEQATVDLIHDYIDEWFLAEADDDLSPGPSKQMLALEEPHGELAPTQPEYAKDPYDSHLRLEANRKQGEVTRVPVNSKSYVYVKVAVPGVDLTTNTTKVMYWYACEANDLVAIDLKSGSVTDADFASFEHEYATGPIGEPARVWIMGQRRSLRASGTCG